MSISHRTNRLKLVGSPSVEQLQNGRYKLTVTCSTMNSREDWYSANKARIFPDFGSLQSAEMSIDGLAPRTGEAYADMRLTQVESGNRSGMGQVGDYNVSLTYETLGSLFVQVKDDNTDYELNGLRRVTRTSIAEAGTDYDKTVGTSYIDHQIDDETAVRCFLAAYAIDDTDSFRQVQEVWLESGTLSETLDNVGSQKAKVIETIGADPATPTGYSLASKQESDFEGFQTNRFTFLKDNVVLSRSIQTKSGGKLILEVVEVFNGTPVADTTGAVKIGDEVSDVDGIPTRRFTFAKGDGQISVDSRPAPAQLAGCTYVTVRSIGTAVTPTGVLVAESETESDGYITYEKTALQGTIVGTKQTYKDVVDVTVAGVVNCTQVSKTSGDISGTIAVAKVTPPRTKTIAATVTVEVTTSPPDTVSLAYDLGDISCSVTSISMSEDFRGTDVFTTQSGKTRYSGQRKSSNMSARVSTYPNCYLSSSTGSGKFSYTSSYENTSTSPNQIVPVAQNSTTKTFTDGTGSTSASYSTTGVVERSSRPILTALDGTIYFEVVTWSV